MNFWRNPKYKTFEKSIVNGDPIRGIPEQKLPYEVARIQFVDGQGDDWEVIVSCIAVAPEKVGILFVVDLKFEAQCTISSQNIAKFGLDSERLSTLFEGANEVSDSRTERIKVSLEHLERAAKERALEYQKILAACFSERTKRIALQANLDQISFSRLA